VRASFLEPRDFTRAPRAPDLSALVRRNYPAAARMYRHEGTVELRALILPDGTPSALRVESVDPSGRGFGEACIRTVQHGPRWQPALNRNGFPVAAEASFVCPFRLEQASNSPQERRN
jgi:TonB family protein